MKPSLVLIALRYQMADEKLWADTTSHIAEDGRELKNPLTPLESYLQESLKDLHEVIENDCPYALKRIKERKNGEEQNE